MREVDLAAGGLQYLRTRDAAAFLQRLGFKVSPATLRQWRWKGSGPKFTKLNPGGEGYYSLADLQEYVATRSYSNTGEVTSQADAKRAA